MFESKGKQELKSKQNKLNSISQGGFNKFGLSSEKQTG
jgi:hypothetical protein